MLAFILRRVAHAIAVVLLVGLVAFSMFRFVGDPVDNLLGQERTIADIAELRERIGLNEPFPVQYLRFLGRALDGELGVSYRLGRPVSELIAERFPATFELTAVSAFLSVSLGVFLGVYAAIHPRGWLSGAIMTTVLVGFSVPTFITGVLLIWVFSVEFGWLPSFGRGETVRIGWWTTGLLTTSGLKSLVLPSITLGLYQMAFTMRLVRSEMLGVLRTDYVRSARARGLGSRAVYFGHALRNTLIPVATLTSLQLGSLLAFSIVTETVFQWPGLGLLFINAIQFVDIPVMATYLMLIAVFFAVINLCVDLAYFALDPRISRPVAGGA